MKCFRCIHSRPAGLHHRVYCTKMAVVTGPGKAQICEHYQPKDRYEETQLIGKTWSEIESINAEVGDHD